MNLGLLRTLARVVFTAGLLWPGVTVTHGQSTPQKPNSRFFVADVAGDSRLRAGDQETPLVKSGVHAAEGAAIETKEDSSTTLVLSNGTALHLTAGSRFEVTRFLQEPFAPNRTELDVEPSISQTWITLSQGSFGVCTSRLVAGSTMVYQTPHGSIAVRGRRLLIAVSAAETRITLLEGDVTATPDGANAGQVLTPGQQAVLRRADATSPATVLVSNVPDAELTSSDDVVANACIARRTVFFEPVEGTAELTPVRTTPAAAPTEFTVSPSRLGS